MFIVSLLVCKFTLRERNANISTLLLKNIEALARGEGGGEGSENGEGGKGCPDHNYVPNRFLHPVIESHTVTTNINGEIEIQGIIKGGFQKNKEITVLVRILACSGIEAGACCDQRKIEVTIM